MSRITDRAKRSLRSACGQLLQHTCTRMYPWPIALCNEIRIRSPVNPCFTRRISHALFLLTVHDDVTTIQHRNASHTAAKRCSPGNRLCVCDYIIVEDKCRYRARKVKMFPRLITAGFSPQLDGNLNSVARGGIPVDYSVC